MTGTLRDPRYLGTSTLLRWTIKLLPHSQVYEINQLNIWCNRRFYPVINVAYYPVFPGLSLLFHLWWSLLQRLHSSIRISISTVITRRHGWNSTTVQNQCQCINPCRNHVVLMNECIWILQISSIYDILPHLSAAHNCGIAVDSGVSTTHNSSSTSFAFSLGRKHIIQWFDGRFITSETNSDGADGVSTGPFYDKVMYHP